VSNPEGLITLHDFNEWGARFLIYQEEVGELGTHHFQGYIEMFKPCKFSYFHPTLLGAHFDKCIGTPQQCEDYCSKVDTRVGGPYRFGFRSKGQGARTDIVNLRNAIRDGLRGRDIYERDDLVGPMVRYCRGVSELISTYEPSVSRESLVVTLHYGPSGTGKTFCAHSDGAYYYDGMCYF